MLILSEWEVALELFTGVNGDAAPLVEHFRNIGRERLRVTRGPVARAPAGSPGTPQ